MCSIPTVMMVYAHHTCALGQKKRKGKFVSALLDKYLFGQMNYYYIRAIIKYLVQFGYIIESYLVSKFEYDISFFRYLFLMFFLNIFDF